MMKMDHHLEMIGSIENMRIITLATIKGGVGKTILSAHLAASLAAKEVETLFIDLDPQGHASLLLGIDAEPGAPCIGDVLLPTADRRLTDVVIRDVRPHLSVAPAILQMALQERQLYAWALRLRAVLKALEQLDDTPDAVVIDTPPHIGAYTEAALHAADLTIAPIPALAGALQGFGDLRAAWEEMQDGRSGKIACVVNMWDGRTKATNAAVLEAIDGLAVPVFSTRIPRAEVINQAALTHQLIFDHAPSAPVSGMLTEFAAEAWSVATEGSRR
jgi:chromosome partitioning protein